MESCFCQDMDKYFALFQVTSTTSKDINKVMFNALKAQFNRGTTICSKKAMFGSSNHLVTSGPDHSRPSEETKWVSKDLHIGKKSSYVHLCAGMHCFFTCSKLWMSTILHNDATHLLLDVVLNSLFRTWGG